MTTNEPETIIQHIPNGYGATVDFDEEGYIRIRQLESGDGDGEEVLLRPHEARELVAIITHLLARSDRPWHPDATIDLP